MQRRSSALLYLCSTKLPYFMSIMNILLSNLTFSNLIKRVQLAEACLFQCILKSVMVLLYNEFATVVAMEVPL